MAARPAASQPLRACSGSLQMRSQASVPPILRRKKFPWTPLRENFPASSQRRMVSEPIIQEIQTGYKWRPRHQGLGTRVFGTQDQVLISCVQASGTSTLTAASGSTSSLGRTTSMVTGGRGSSLRSAKSCSSSVRQRSRVRVCTGHIWGELCCVGERGPIQSKGDARWQGTPPLSRRKFIFCRRIPKMPLCKAYSGTCPTLPPSVRAGDLGGRYACVGSVHRDRPRWNAAPGEIEGAQDPEGSR